MEAGATQSADINPNVAEPQLSEHSKSEEKNKLEPEENEIIAELTQQIANGPKDPNYERLKGWRLWSTTLFCNACVFLGNLEVAIVSTSLVAITDDLKEFSRSSWIITAYLLTYTGFLIIWAKLSDTVGRRQCLSLALTIFITASGACGGANTITQLIIFRAFQGLGGSGLISIPFVILPEMVEPQRYALWGSFTSFAFVLGFLFGPLFGGAIVGSATWRWVFLINLPLGIATLILLLVCMPARFPYRNSKRRINEFTKLKEIDYFGVTLVFASSAFIVSALEEAGTTYAWSSAPIVILLALAGVSISIFVGWEYFVDNKMKTRQAVFTWRLMKHRVFMGAVLISFLSGVPFTVAVIQIPQEWQTVANTTALVAGIRLLPFTLCFNVGQVLAMILTSRLHIPLIFVIFLGSSCQIIGMTIQSLIPLHTGGGKYGSEVLMGVGIGANIAVLVQLTPQLIRGRDQAAAMGAITQFRALGGVIGLAIATNVFNDYVRSKLSKQLAPDQLTYLLESVATGIDSLAPDVQMIVRSVFASAYDLQTKTMIGFAAGQALAVSLMWEKKLRRLI